MATEATYPETESFSGGTYGVSATRDQQPFRGIVIHVTGKPDLKSELDYMSKPDPNRAGQFGYHYLIDKDGSIYQTAPFNVRTNHILPNKDYGLNNNNSLGVAFVGGDKGITDMQIAAGKQLTGELQSRFNIPANMVVSHGTLDPGTRGAGHNLGVDNTAEGQQFIAALQGGQQPHGTTLTSTPSTGVSDLVANLESGNRNVIQGIQDINTEKGTPAGGYFQIIDPTWRTYAPKAGVDLQKYPFAMAADRDTQLKVASAIPLNQWGENTRKALQAKYPGIDLGMTLGQADTKYGGGAPAVAAKPSGFGALFTPGPPDAKGNPTPSPASQTMAALQKAFGGGGGDGGQGQGQGSQEAPQAPPGVAPPGARNVPMNALMEYGPMAQAIAAQAAIPLKWTREPYGANAGFTSQPGAGAGLVPGTSLNSMPDEMISPWMAQMTGAASGPYG